MIDAANAAGAAEVLLGHWDAGTKLGSLPSALRPSSRAEGYAIQAQWMRHTKRPLFGWKIAATSTAGQRHINVGGPLAGRILAEKVMPDGATIPLAGNGMRVVELELAFRFGRDIPPRSTPYSVDEVLAAVASLHPALEIPDSRFEDFTAVGEAQLIADDACAHLFMLGEATIAPWRDMDLAAHEVSAEVVGKSTHPGKGANVLGDPRVALAWLVNEVSGLGLTLGAWQVVTTGTCVVPIAIVPGDRVRARFGILGGMEVAFS
jgi:2-keto-4-pentenoate hydratase